MDISDLEQEDWEELWDKPFRQLVSIRDQLINFTPHRIHQKNLAQQTLPPVGNVIIYWGTFHIFSGLAHPSLNT